MGFQVEAESSIITRNLVFTEQLMLLLLHIYSPVMLQIIVTLSTFNLKLFSWYQRSRMPKLCKIVRSKSRVVSALIIIATDIS